jgi:DNA-damage-inducible protein J|tara:strand:- start:1379 stop:1645 length:267 start_codon:yes stop_codon:yes gene_type:complete
MRTAHINVRTEPETKKNAESILKKLGMTTSEAINLFLRRVIMSKGIPFDVRIPNEKTIEAMEDIEKSRNLSTAHSVDEMFEDLGISVD